MVAATNADFALLNSGELRSDSVHHAGPFFLKDLLNILPCINPLVLLEVTGEQVFQCLENGVSQVPKLEGRFPQVNKNTEIAALKVSLVIALTPSPLYYLHNVSLLLLGWNPAARPAVRLGYLHSL